MCSSVIVQTLLENAMIFQSTGMYNIIYNIINQKCDLLGLLTYFAFTWSSLKSIKSIFESAFRSNTLYKYVYVIILNNTKAGVVAL